MPKRIHVLFCMEDLCFGGTQRQTLELVKRLDQERFRPSFVVFTGETDLDGILRERGIPVRYLGSGRKVFPFFFLTLGKMLLADRPDLIVPCTALPNIWARIWGKILGIPVLGTCRGGGGPKRQHERFLWPLTCHMICNSQALVTVLTDIGVPKNHLTCIENGCNTDFFLPGPVPPSKRNEQLLCVARLCQDKDHRTLFEAYEKLLPRFPNLTLRLVGDGPEEASLKQWAHQHSHLSIEFVPGVEDVRPYYQQARIFVLSSNKEGQPNVLLEAMSSGLPVCATHVGGIPALVHDQQTGLLSPAMDAAKLAENIAYLLENPEEGDTMGMKGRDYVLQSHSFSSMVEAHQDLFTRFARSDCEEK
ncbi:MAG: glycosyltransferase family 4 protein [Desulfovibrio sp.]|nr:glycosyltransferase family 4 protein [Desulfovibrio sp.]